MKRLFVALVVLLFAVPALSGTITIGKKKGGGACTPSASGTVIVGSSTEATGDDVSIASNQELFFDTAYSATWAGDCTTETVGTIEVYMKGWEGGDCKAIIGTSTGNLLTNGVSNSASVEYEDNASWHSFSMGTPPTITKSTAYRIGVVCSKTPDGTIALFPAATTGTSEIGSDTTGTYTTPTSMDTHDAVWDASSTIGGFRGKK